MLTLLSLSFTLIHTHLHNVHHAGTWATWSWIHRKALADRSRENRWKLKLRKENMLHMLTFGSSLTIAGTHKLLVTKSSLHHQITTSSYLSKDPSQTLVYSTHSLDYQAWYGWYGVEYLVTGDKEKSYVDECGIKDLGVFIPALFIYSLVASLGFLIVGVSVLKLRDYLPDSHHVAPDDIASGLGVPRRGLAKNLSFTAPEVEKRYPHHHQRPTSSRLLMHELVVG